MSDLPETWMSMRRCNMVYTSVLCPLRRPERRSALAIDNLTRGHRPTRGRRERVGRRQRVTHRHLSRSLEYQRGWRRRSLTLRIDIGRRRHWCQPQMSPELCSCRPRARTSRRRSSRRRSRDGVDHCRPAQCRQIFLCQKRNVSGFFLHVLASSRLASPSRL